MYLSSRVKDIGESITLKLNDKANSLAEQGKRIFNLTAGQLPFKPMPEFIQEIESELNFLKSFQYGPVAGLKELRKKIIKQFETTRGIDLSKSALEFDCVISNGGKHSIYNVLGAIIEPQDEVIIISPYWVSYPEMIKCWGGKPVVVAGQKYNAFIPTIDDIRKALHQKTRAIIINSPNNPSGIHYPKTWMEDFANLVKEFPQLILISDEIYFDLYYFDPQPTYFYQFNTDLLARTVIIDGISKSYACTGLRIGYCLASSELTNAVARLQAQTTSGPNTLVQRALVNFDFTKVNEFLGPIKIHLRNNATIIQNKFREKGLEHTWYQTTSAFYYLIDFTKMPVFDRYKSYQNKNMDVADKICSDLLEQYNVAIVPGSDFGLPNSGRLSLVLEESAFKEALTYLTDFLIEK